MKKFKNLKQKLIQSKRDSQKLNEAEIAIILNQDDTSLANIDCSAYKISTIEMNKINSIKRFQPVQNKQNFAYNCLQTTLAHWQDEGQISQTTVKYSTGKNKKINALNLDLFLENLRLFQGEFDRRKSKHQLIVGRMRQFLKQTEYQMNNQASEQNLEPKQTKTQKQKKKQEDYEIKDFRFLELSPVNEQEYIEPIRYRCIKYNNANGTDYSSENDDTFPSNCEEVLLDSHDSSKGEEIEHPQFSIGEQVSVNQYQIRKNFSLLSRITQEEESLSGSTSFKKNRGYQKCESNQSIQVNSQSISLREENLEYKKIFYMLESAKKQQQRLQSMKGNVQICKRQNYQKKQDKKQSKEKDKKQSKEKDEKQSKEKDKKKILSDIISMLKSKYQRQIPIKQKFVDSNNSPLQ